MLILRNIIYNDKTSSSKKKSNIFYGLKFSLKIKNSNDITECCIVGYKYYIVGYISIYSNKDFSSLKMTYLIFNWHNSATNWNFLMQFSTKRFTLAALSVYYNYTEIVKTLSFDL